MYDEEKGEGDRQIIREKVKEKKKLHRERQNNILMHIVFLACLHTLRTLYIICIISGTITEGKEQRSK